MHRGGGLDWIIAVDRDAGLVAVALANKTGGNVGGAAFDALLEAFLAAAAPRAEVPR